MMPAPTMTVETVSEGLLKTEKVRVSSSSSPSLADMVGNEGRVNEDESNVMEDRETEELSGYAPYCYYLCITYNARLRPPIIIKPESHMVTWTLRRFLSVSKYDEGQFTGGRGTPAAS